MRNLNEIQIKSLITGVSLAADVEASAHNIRCFISIRPYQYNEFAELVEMTNFLKKIDSVEIFFVLRKYEIPDDYIKNGWDVCEHELINFVYKEDIKEFKNLENVLLKYMNDLSSLEPEWKCENPL